MPRSPTTRRVGGRQRSASHLLQAVWHTSCMVFASGCLYIAPVWRPEVNQAPQVTIPSSLDQQQLKMISDRATVVVAANDPEDEVVSFVWFVPHGVGHEISEWQNDNGDFVSTLTVDRHDALDGSIITCTISDQAKPRHVVNIEWLVEVL